MYWEQDEGLFYIRVGRLTLWVKDRRKWVLSWLERRQGLFVGEWFVGVAWE